MSVISEIILTLEEFAEEFMTQSSIPRDVFLFEAGVDEDEETFVIALRLNYPNALAQSSRGLGKYTLHSLPTEALISIYEEDGFNKYLADHIEPQMPERTSIFAFTLPNGYVYQPQGWLNTPASQVLVANMPTRPAASLLSPYPSGIEPLRVSMFKNRTNQTDDSPFIFNTNLCQEVEDDYWLTPSYEKAKDHLDAVLLMHDEIYRREAKKHVESIEQNLILHSSS